MLRQPKKKTRSKVNVGSSPILPLGLHQLLLFLSPPTHPNIKKVTSFSEGYVICYIEREAQKRNLSTLLRFLFKFILQQKTPKNFPEFPGAITLIRKSDGKMKVCNFLAAAKDSFPKSGWLNLSDPNSVNYNKNSRFCADCGSLNPSLCRALKRTFPTDISGIVVNEQITTDLGSGSIEQSVYQYGILQCEGLEGSE